MSESMSPDPAAPQEMTEEEIKTAIVMCAALLPEELNDEGVALICRAVLALHKRASASEAARAAAEERLERSLNQGQKLLLEHGDMMKRAEAAEAQAARLQEPLAMVWHLICRAVGEHEATREGGGAHVYIDYSDARDILAALTQPSSQEDARHGE
jgi:hypothetical protein